MRLTRACLLLGVATAVAGSLEQKPLGILSDNPVADLHSQDVAAPKRRPLHGRFLHITDFHPDPWYKVGSKSSKKKTCHRGSGDAGYYGAEKTDCDTPFSLINATFDWLNEHVKDEIDFVVWTGDSARHDSDNKIPRTEQSIVSLNEMLVTKFYEVFGTANQKTHSENKHFVDASQSSKPAHPSTDDFILPIVPSFGNNDIMPHNIMTLGPNFWTETFANLWSGFIPEEQLHTFQRGGQFFVEVIPDHLAVFSLNTLYFFDSNGAVDGCANRHEPGYEQMEWLRIQLQFLRGRGMKAILIGHVPPARTRNKMNWDETCWQKYTLWMRQYRDVVVGSVYGHMNIDHFILQDFADLKKKTLKGRMAVSPKSKAKGRAELDDDSDQVTIQSPAKYLKHLAQDWAKIPERLKHVEYEDDDDESEANLLQTWTKYFQNMVAIFRKKKRKNKHMKGIGGKWAERYSMSLVSASVIPNFYPTFRIIEYNISGIGDHKSLDLQSTRDEAADALEEELHDQTDTSTKVDRHDIETSKKHKQHKKKKKQKFTVPHPPSKSSPPGPAYSPQTLTWVRIQQYYANLTRINAEHAAVAHKSDLAHVDKDHKKHPALPDYFTFDLEYDTRNDSAFADLNNDLTVHKWVKMARRIGRHVSPSSLSTLAQSRGMSGDRKEDVLKQLKKEAQRARELWYTFLSRAYVGTKGQAELEQKFGC